MPMWLSAKAASGPFATCQRQCLALVARLLFSDDEQHHHREGDGAPGEDGGPSEGTEDNTAGGPVIDDGDDDGLDGLARLFSSVDSETDDHLPCACASEVEVLGNIAVPATCRGAAEAEGGATCSGQQLQQLMCGGGRVHVERSEARDWWTEALGGVARLFSYQHIYDTADELPPSTSPTLLQASTPEVEREEERAAAVHVPTPSLSCSLADGAAQAPASSRDESPSGRGGRREREACVHGDAPRRPRRYLDDLEVDVSRLGPLGGSLWAMRPRQAASAPPAPHLPALSELPSPAPTRPSVSSSIALTNRSPAPPSVPVPSLLQLPAVVLPIGDGLLLTAHGDEAAEEATGYVRGVAVTVEGTTEDSGLALLDSSTGQASSMDEGQLRAMLGLRQQHVRQPAGNLLRPGTGSGPPTSALAVAETDGTADEEQGAAAAALMDTLEQCDRHQHQQEEQHVGGAAPLLQDGEGGGLVLSSQSPPPPGPGLGSGRHSEGKTSLGSGWSVRPARFQPLQPLAGGSSHGMTPRVGGLVPPALLHQPGPWAPVVPGHTGTHGELPAFTLFGARRAVAAPAARPPPGSPSPGQRMAHVLRPSDDTGDLGLLVMPVPHRPRLLQASVGSNSSSAAARGSALRVLTGGREHRASAGHVDKGVLLDAAERAGQPLEWSPQPAPIAPVPRRPTISLEAARAGVVGPGYNNTLLAGGLEPWLPSQQQQQQLARQADTTPRRRLQVLRLLTGADGDEPEHVAGPSLLGGLAVVPRAMDGAGALGFGMGLDWLPGAQQPPMLPRDGRPSVGPAEPAVSPRVMLTRSELVNSPLQEGLLGLHPANQLGVPVPVRRFLPVQDSVLETAPQPTGASETREEEEERRPAMPEMSEAMVMHRPAPLRLLPSAPVEADGRDFVPIQDPQEMAWGQDEESPASATGLRSLPLHSGPEGGLAPALPEGPSAPMPEPVPRWLWRDKLLRSTRGLAFNATSPIMPERELFERARPSPGTPRRTWKCRSTGPGSWARVPSGRPSRSHGARATAAPWC